MILGITYVAFKGMKEVAFLVIFEILIQLMLPKEASGTFQVDHLEIICVFGIVEGENKGAL